jgi:hypothetical protein
VISIFSASVISTPAAVLAAFRESAAVAADDAVTFDAEGATIERIR